MKLEPTVLPTHVAETAKKDSDATRDAAHSFEALLINEMFKTMRRAGPQAEHGFGESVFTAMLDETLAQHMAESETFGLSSVLMQELGAPQPQETAPAVDSLYGHKAPDAKKDDVP